MASGYWRNTQVFNYATVEQKVKRSIIFGGTS